jgi:uncharacterized protein (TIGR03083 family)
MNKALILRGVKAQRRATLALLGDLEPAQFDLPTALPGWRVREVIAHLITTDRAAVIGSSVLVLFGPMKRLEAWNDRQVSKWAARSVTDLQLGLDRWGRGLLRLYGTIPSRLYDLRVPTIFGRAPLGLLMWSRVYDEWIHRQDIRRALGRPDQEVDLELPAEFLLNAIRWDTLGKLKGRSRRVSVALDGVAVAEWTYDLAAGEGHAIAGMASERAMTAGNADARITAAGSPFLMASADRDRFDDLRADGRLKIEGDERLAGEFLAALRIV